MAAAHKQHVILTKIRVFREIRLHGRKKGAVNKKFRRAVGQLRANLAKKVLDGIVLHAATEAIRRSQRRRAESFRRRHLLKTAYMSLFYFRDIVHSQNLVKLKAHQIYKSKTLRKTLTQLTRYVIVSREKHELAMRCE